MKRSKTKTLTAVSVFLSLLAGVGITACATQETESGTGVSAHGMHAIAPVYELPLAVPGGAVSPLDAVINAGAGADVILIGETHDRYEHHLSQLEVIKRLHARGENLVIGMEYFHRPFQGALDDYVAGRIDETTLLKRTEYFRRWGFDYRLYRPILAYAREHRIPLVALNADKDLTDRVRAVGVEGLNDDEKSQLPRLIDRSNRTYENRLKDIFKLHPGRDHDNEATFRRFMDVQLIWDETMAETAAEALKKRPGFKLVLLAGSGHIAYGYGIPDRLQRNLGASSKLLTLVLLSTEEMDRNMADFLLVGPSLELPPAGRMGIFMLDSENGVRVAGLSPGGAAEKVGIPEDAILVSVDGNQTPRTMDVRLALMGKAPGETVRLGYRPKPSENIRSVDLVLGGAVKHHPASRKH